LADNRSALIRWKRSGAQRHGINRASTSSTSRWMAALIRRPPEYQSKTARTSSSPVRRFFVPGITPKQFVNCAANERTKDPWRLAYLCRSGGHDRLRFCSGFSHHFVSLRDANNFFDSCFALGYASPAILPQSLHAFGNSTLLQLAAVTPPHDQLSQRLRDDAHFINRCATLVTGMATLITTGPAPETSTEFLQRETDLCEVIAGIIDFFDAIRANRAHEPLGNKRLHHRGEQKRFHVHVEQTRNATYGVIRVERAENKVTRHRGTNRNVRSLDVSDFADHDHIRVLSQYVSQAYSENQINLWFHVDLRDTRDSIFHRFFNRNDAALNGIDAAEKTIQRG